MATEQESLAALDKLHQQLTAPKAPATSIPDLCAQYRQLKPLLQAALFAIGLIPNIGPKVVAAIKFLMSIADTACPA